MAETDGRMAESVQDSSKGSVASQTQKDEQSTDTVEIRFISFAKKYVGLLATVASIPLISAGIGVLPQPPEGQAKLNLLSSVLCLIMFSACFLLRGPLDKAFTSRESRVLNIIPFVLALFFMFLAILLTSYYIQFSVENAQTTNIDLAPYNIKLSVERYGSYIGGKFVPNRTDIFWQVFMYIWIYPLVVLSLGIVLMTIFALQHARDIQDLIANRVLDKHKEIFEFVKNYANFYDLSKTFPSPKKANNTNSLEISNSKEKKTGNPSSENKDQEGKRDLVNSKKTLEKKDVDRRPLLDIGEEFIIPFYKLLEKLGKGQLEIEGTNTPRIQRLLMQHFSDSFDAVSDSDLDFWLGRRDRYLAEAYIRLNEEAIHRKTRVTRIFILSDDEAFSEGDSSAKKNNIVTVLTKQQQMGIGWAVAWHEEIYEGLKDKRDVDLDFALFNHDRAVSFFRTYRRWTRLFSATLATSKENEKEIEKHVQQHREILSQCWLANERLKCNLNDILETKEFKEQVKSLNKILGDKLTALLNEEKSESAKDYNFESTQQNQIFLLEVKKDANDKEIAQKVDLLLRLREKSKRWNQNNSTAEQSNSSTVVGG